MNRITCKGLMMGLLMLLSTSYINAQYLFTQSFSNPAVLSKTGWYLGSAHSTTYRDTVNGYMAPGEGSLHVSFNDLAAGDIDTLRLPVFTASGMNDSIRFDHAHRGTSRDVDSMSVFYSTNGGATMLLLHTYIGSETPDSTTLSTVLPGSGRYKPASGTDWATKAIALPAGTNTVMFVFYSGSGDELYLDNIMIGQQPAFCPGAPVLGGMPSSIVSCAGTSFYILPDTFTVNSFITYEWKRSLDNGVNDPWTTATNGYGTNTPEFYLTNLTQSYWYRLEATCGSTTFSTAVFVTPDSSYNCYCRSNLGGYCNAWITGVQLGANLNNTSACASGTNAFTFYTPGAGTTDTLTAGDPYASISVGTDLFGPWLKARVGFWIDYNRDGMYDSSEFNMINTAAGTETNTFQFTVPANAATGITGLRVRAAENGSFFPAGSFQLMDGRHACTNGTSGETEEYLIYIKPAPACTSTPVAGTFRDTIYTICQGNAVVFIAEGASFGPDITYQWEESADDGLFDPWHSITGANDRSYITPALTTKNYYRLKVECTTFSASAYSPSIEVNVNPFYTCYCATNLGGDRCNSSTAYISNVSVSNTTINNTTSCSNNVNSYSKFDTSATVSDTVYNDQLITVNVTNTQFAGRVGLWIDYDHSGTYEKSEFTLVTSASTPNTPSAALVHIPATALNGYTGMRVRLVNSGWTLDSADACSNLATGETEDYIINIQPAPACSGTPVTGLYTKTYNICSGSAVSINAPDASFGTGIAYQWQSSLDGIIWGNVITGTGYDSRQFTSLPLTDSVFYRLSITCNGGTVVYGDTVKVNIKPFYACYCATDLGAGYSCQSGEYIANVSFPSRNLNVTSTCNNPSPDNSYTYNSPVGSATDSVTAGDEVVIAARYEGSFPSRIAVWIDYNQDGTFSNTEFTLVSSNAPSGNTVTGTITIPVGATQGYTGMRVRATNYSASLDSADACAYLGDGETEDYAIYIRPAVPCNSTVVSGTIPANELMCPGKDFTITATGSTVGSGITYEWQESDDNGNTDPWTVVSGSSSAKTLSVTGGVTQAIYYRLKVTCTNTFDSVFTNSMQMIIDTFYNCYDANTDLGGGQCNNDYISNVSIDGTTLDNTSLCNNTPKGARTVFPASGNTTATLVAGMTYTINVTPNYVKSMGVWIDFNRNGVYEASEFKLIAQRSNVQSSAPVIVPANAVPGLTGMRVRTNEPRAISFPVGGIYANQSAANFFQGETEDYVILIDTLKPATNVTATGITASTVTVSWNNGNGNGRLVLAKEDTTALSNPVDGTTYNADVIYASGNSDETGAGNYVVYASDRDTSVTIEGLDSNRNYNFYVYEYIDAPRKYFVPGQSASATTLPVSLLSFSGIAVKNNAQLSWSTASEKNNKGFYVERSADGKHFTTIAFVAGKGNTATISNYTYTDVNAFGNGTNRWLYRLRQTDYNGASANSGTISVAGKEIAGITITPNPFENNLVISLNGYIGAATVRITDMLGHEVKAHVLQAGQNPVEIETHDLANGVYFVNIQAGTELHRYKVVKSRNEK
jgi:hypothetical protein